MNQDKDRPLLFIDSGAYSAWALSYEAPEDEKVTIDIEEYIEFIRYFEPYIDVYANLDVIGEAKGSYENWLYMRARGLNPMPVFHAGTDLKYLTRYLEATDYIALGALVGPSSGMSDTIKSLDMIWGHYLTDDDGMPLVKVHGFGLTTIRSIRRYPWYSVDSSAWCAVGRNGAIIIPKRINREWCYDEMSWKIPVSTRSPKKQERGFHYESCSVGKRRVVDEYLEHLGYKMGKSEFTTCDPDHKLDPEQGEAWKSKELNPDGSVDMEIIIERGVCNDYHVRDEVNVLYYIHMEKSVPEWPWAFRMNRSGIFV